MLAPLGPFDVLLANPPYIPNPKKAAPDLLAYGDGGHTGEEVRADPQLSSKCGLLHLIRTLVLSLASQVTEAIVALAGEVLAEEANLYLVGNLANVDSYPAKLARWWPSTGAGLSAVVSHGVKWSPAEYASLILSRPEDGQQVMGYSEALRDAGVVDVTNGFVFGRKSASGEAGGVIACVQFVHDQLWQAVAQEAAARDGESPVESGLIAQLLP
jgi:hypothetical protein